MSEPVRPQPLVGLAGIAYALLSIIVGPMCPQPFPTNVFTGAESAAYFAANQNMFLIGNYLGLVAFLPGLPLFAYTAARIRAKEAADGWIWLMVLMGGVLAHSVGAIDLALYEVAALPAARATPELAKLCLDMAAVTFGFCFLLIGFYALVTSVAALKLGVFSKASGLVGLVVGVLCCAASLGTLFLDNQFLAIPGQFVGGAFVLFFAWQGMIAVDAWRGR